MSPPFSEWNEWKLDSKKDVETAWNRIKRIMLQNIAEVWGVTLMGNMEKDNDVKTSMNEGKYAY